MTLRASAVCSSLHVERSLEPRAGRAKQAPHVGSKRKLGGLTGHRLNTLADNKFSQCLFLLLVELVDRSVQFGQYCLVLGHKGA